MSCPTSDSLQQGEMEQLNVTHKIKFTRCSFDYVSVDRVALCIETSKGGFNQYFPDKRDACFVAARDLLERHVVLTNHLSSEIFFGERMTSIIQNTQSFQSVDSFSGKTLPQDDGRSEERR